jgi:hypothetical protein
VRQGRFNAKPETEGFSPSPQGVAKGEVTDMPGLAVSRRLVELWIDDALDGQSEGPALGARDLRPTSGAKGLIEIGYYKISVRCTGPVDGTGLAENQVAAVWLRRARRSAPPAPKTPMIIVAQAAGSGAVVDLAP